MTSRATVAGAITNNIGSNKNTIDESMLVGGKRTDEEISLSIIIEFGYY